jgi:hypothetical protein
MTSETQMEVFLEFYQQDKERDADGYQGVHYAIRLANRYLIYELSLVCGKVFLDPR